MPVTEFQLQEQCAEPDRPIRFDEESLSYVISTEEAELCKMSILHDGELDINGVRSNLAGLTINDDGTFRLSLHTARITVGSLDKLLDLTETEYGKHDQLTRSIYSLNLRLALAIFNHDTTFGTDQMQALRDQKEERRWRVISHLCDVLGLVS